MQTMAAAVATRTSERSAVTTARSVASHSREEYSSGLWCGLKTGIAHPTVRGHGRSSKRPAGRPLQGRTLFGPWVSVGFTYGYSWFPASRERMQRIGNELNLVYRFNEIYLLR